MPVTDIILPTVDENARRTASRPPAEQYTPLLTYLVMTVRSFSVYYTGHNVISVITRENENVNKLEINTELIKKIGK